MQAVMSFHKCGMFGDVCDIPVPAWARAVPDIWWVWRCDPSRCPTTRR